MSILHSLFYFCFYISVVLIYGVGILQFLHNSEKLSMTLVFECIITTIISLVVVILLRLISINILVPLSLQALMPLIALLILMPFTILIKELSNKTKYVDCANFFITVPCAILAVTESLSMKNMIFMVISFVLAYYLLIPAIYAIRQRINNSRPIPDFNNGSLLFITIAVILCAFFSCDVSWLNLGA